MGEYVAHDSSTRLLGPSHEIRAAMRLPFPYRNTDTLKLASLT